MTMASASSPALSTAVLRVVLSQFCRARRLFLDECFEWTRLHDDLDPVCVLRKPPLVDRGAEQLYNLIEFGVAECLDRQCIRSVTLYIMDATNGHVLEELTMDCSPYHGEYLSTTPIDALRELTRKHRLLVQTLKPLPIKTSFAVRLTLIGPKIPYPSWRPPYFLTATIRSTAKQLQLRQQSVSLRIGTFDSDCHSCTLSIRSSQDPLQELSQNTQLANDSNSDVVFDPEFTQVPDAHASNEMRNDHDVSLYQTIKAFVIASAVPSMQRTHQAHKTLAMPTIRTYFNRLCEEGHLKRRGRRFYGVKQATAIASSSSVGPKKTSVPTIRESPLLRTPVSPKPTLPRDMAITKLYQSYQQCWIARNSIVSSSSHATRGEESNHSSGKPAQRSSNRKVVFAATNPITQLSKQHQSRHRAKPGQSVLVASTSIVQTSNESATTA